jgi:hypothetical protein
MNNIIILIIILSILIIFLNNKRTFQFFENNNIHFKKNIDDIQPIGKLSNKTLLKLKNIVTKSNLWDNEPLVKQRSKKYKVHMHTESFFIIKSGIMDFDINDITYPDTYKLCKSEINEINNILKQKYNFIDGIIGKILVAKLKKGSKIYEHKDNGYGLLTSCRIHIPIITNKKVLFTCGNTTKHLEEGKLYEINNSIRHSVDNNSDEDRIHLIIDYYDKYNINYQQQYFNSFNSNSNLNLDLKLCSGEIQERLSQKPIPNHVFIISSSNSGSTMLSKYISNCSNVSSFNREGQFLNFSGPNPRNKNTTKHLYLETYNIYNNEKNYNWESIKKSWYNNWDTEKPICLEKSPTNITRIDMLKKHFPNVKFIFLIRNPYAISEGIVRGNKINDFERAGKQSFGVLKMIKEKYEKYKSISHLIKYEDLCDNTMSEKKRLISFLPELNDINFDKTLQIKKYNKPITNMNNEQINRLNKTNINAINIHYDKSVMDYLGYSNI